MLYLTWGLMVGTGLGFGYLTPITVGSKWFPNQRGLVNGLAIGIFAAGSGIFGPIAGKLVEQIGWRSTFQVLAAIFFVFTMVGAYLPEESARGLSAAGHPRGEGRQVARVQRRRPDLASAADASFYILWLAYALGTTAGTMVISQLVPFARSSGLTGNTAAFAITVGAIGSASGRFFSGWMSDHFGRLLTLRGVIVISMLATPSLYLLRTEPARLLRRVCFSFTTATARSSRCTPPWPGIFTARSTWRRTTGFCCSHGVLPASSVR